MKALKLLSHAVATVFILDSGLETSLQAANSFQGKCLLEIGHQKYLDGLCPITVEANGGFTIGASEMQPLTYFAMVSITGKNRGEGFWNEEKGANHAHSPLGKLIKKGACWQNSQAKICAWK